jgi:hypothetical protein
MIRIHNSQTNEIIDREMTAVEFQAYQAEQAQEVIKATAAANATTAKAALLARLGITADEAALLLG